MLNRERFKSMESEKTQIENELKNKLKMMTAELD